MGDEILKRVNIYSFFIIIVFISTTIFASDSNLNLGNDTAKYDKIFEQISQTRVGIDSKEINKIKNPFIVIYKNKLDSNGTKKRKIVYKLEAIFDNKAMINGKWYKKYSKIGVYKLAKVKQNSVLLRSANMSKELYIRNRNGSKFQFSSK